MKAMVLAAGKGTRLFPLTGVIPKPMAPVAGKPVLQHIFDLLARAGVEEVHANVHYLADTILGLCEEETRVDGVKIHFTCEARLTGTAGGVRRLASEGAFDKTFVVIMGDALTDAVKHHAVCPSSLSQWQSANGFDTTCPDAKIPRGSLPRRIRNRRSSGWPGYSIQCHS